MQLYAGLDLHSRNTYIGIMDREFKRVFNKRVCNDLPVILATLAPVRDLARKRLLLVRHKTAHILSLQSLIARCSNKRIRADEIRQFTVEDLQQLLNQEYIVISLLS